MANDTLDTLNKALANVVATSNKRKPWQEDYSRHLLSAAQAKQSMENFVGSWAARAAVLDSQAVSAYNATAKEPHLVSSLLGRPGLPEINFVPYNWGTNQNTAYMGHPISFSIVGPTVKHYTNNWQWRYNVGDNSLTLDTVSFDGSTLTVATLEQVFGLTAIPQEGLYCVVSQTGSSSDIADGALPYPTGGVGDGFINSANYLGIPRKALLDGTGTGRYEIFRVQDVNWTGSGTDAKITLEPNKSLGTVFATPLAPVTPVIRAITLLKPYVTRLQQVSETTYLAMTPEQSANADTLPARGESNIPGSWMGGSFAPYDISLQGDVPSYGGQAVLPMTAPKGSGKARLQTNRFTTADGLPFEPGILKLSNYSGAISAGDVIHIQKLEQNNPAVNGYTTVYDAYHDDGLLDSYFEVLSLVAASGGSPAHLRCKFLPQTDPATGNLYYGPSVVQAKFDLDGTTIAARGCIQVVKTGAVPFGSTFYVTITTATTTNSYMYMTLVANASALEVANGIASAIASTSVTASVDIPTTTVQLTASLAGVSGNSIGFSHTTSTSNITLEHTGTLLGQTSYSGGYSGTSEIIGSGLGTTAYQVQVSYTVHDPVSALYTSPYFDAQKIQQNRLTNLIDPSWNKNALSKMQNPVDPTVNLVAGRSDKAIFNTEYNSTTLVAANPGSLLDLGFRMVVYPAKQDSSGFAVPDMDRPITTSNVTLNSGSSSSQSIVIDYSAGAVQLSEAAVPGASCTIAPHGIVGTASGKNNTRGEIVLFAACVPYSRMPSQQEGIRVVTSEQQPLPYYNGISYQNSGTVDLFGTRIKKKIAGYFGVAQTLQSQSTSQVLYLEDIDSPIAAQSTTASVTFNTPPDGTQITLTLYTSAYRVTLTAKNVPTSVNHFLIGITDDITAQNFVDCLAAHPKIQQILYGVPDAFGHVALYSREVGVSASSSSWPFPALLSSFLLSSTDPTHLSVATGLTAQGTTDTIPMRGFLEIVEQTGNIPAELQYTDVSGTIHTAATFQYSGKSIVWDFAAGKYRTKLTGVFGGRKSGDNLDLTAKSYYAVLRRADVLPNDYYGNTGTPYQADTLAGHAAKTTTLAFPGASLSSGAGGATHVDYTGTFVKVYGDTMTGGLTVTATPGNGNPVSQDNSYGISGTGHGTGTGVLGTGGATSTAGIVGIAGSSSNGSGIIGLGDGTGAGILGTGGSGNAYGVVGTGSGTRAGVRGIGGGTSGAGIVGAGGAPNGAGGYFTGTGSGDGTTALGGSSDGVGIRGTGQGTGAGVVGAGGATNGAGVQGTGTGSGAGISGVGGTSGYGVQGTGARGLVGSSNAIATYPQGRLIASGTALPSNKLKGDLWVPDNAGVDWDGHILIYNGSRYLDSCASLLRKQLFTATTAAYSLSGASFLAGDSFDISVTPYAQTQKFQSSGAGQTATIWWEVGIDAFYNGLTTGINGASALVYRCKTNASVTYKVVLNRYRAGAMIGVLTVKTGSTNNGTLSFLTANTAEISAATGFSGWGTLATMLQDGDTFYVGLEIDFSAGAQNVYFYDMFYNHYEIRHAAY